MKTIIFKREVDESNLLEIAKRKGYKTQIEQEIEGGDTILVDNDELPEEYLARVYQKMIDDDIKKIVKEIETEDLKKEYEEKIQATEEAVEENVGETEIEIV